jgi:hypothetical protein
MSFLLTKGNLALVLVSPLIEGYGLPFSKIESFLRLLPVIEICYGYLLSDNFFISIFLLKIGAMTPKINKFDLL